MTAEPSLKSRILMALFSVRERLLNEEVAGLFTAEVYELSRKGDWTSDEHFSADGTLIEAWASMKSSRSREEQIKATNAIW